METAKTILEQLGGNRFIAMTGSHSFVGDARSLTFRIKGTRKTNMCKIALNSLDLYTVTFYKYSPKYCTCKESSQHVNIYFDMLQDLFTEVTGLYTHL